MSLRTVPTTRPRPCSARWTRRARGGATLIQLREKDTGGRSYLELAQQVKAVTDRYNVPLIIDDRVDVAIACDAAGVHVGASDLPGGGLPQAARPG